MQWRAIFNFKKFDWILWLAVILLVSLGLIVQYSLNFETKNFGTLNMQAAVAGVGLILIFILAAWDYRGLMKGSWVVYGFSLLLLATTLILGRVAHGTKGWLWGFQVVELAKVALVVMLARFWAGKKEGMYWPENLIKGLVLVLIPVALILLQPDFGSAMVLIGTGFLFLLLLDRRLKLVAGLVALGIILGVGAWFLVFEDYQKERVLTFIEPTRDPRGSGYQITQSVIAVGSGRFLGSGFGLGSQSQLKFLPEAKTDFAFSVVAEELGFLVAGLALVFYAVIFWRVWRLIREAYDDFGVLLAFGFGAVFLIQITVNIGMNLGVAPITGIPLPFVSYGGSSLISCLIMIGLLESINAHQIKV